MSDRNILPPNGFRTSVNNNGETVYTIPTSANNKAASVEVKPMEFKPIGEDGKLLNNKYNIVYVAGDSDKQTWGIKQRQQGLAVFDDKHNLVGVLVGQREVSSSKDEFFSVKSFKFRNGDEYTLPHKIDIEMEHYNGQITGIADKSSMKKAINSLMLRRDENLQDKANNVGVNMEKALEQAAISSKTIFPEVEVTATHISFPPIPKSKPMQK